MNVFSFRAECKPDVENFMRECLIDGIQSTVAIYPAVEPPGIPDVDVEFQTEGTLESLQDVMRRIQDGHVMLQTLRECPLKDNSLERDYNLV